MKLLTKLTSKKIISRLPKIEAPKGFSFQFKERHHNRKPTVEVGVLLMCGSKQIGSLWLESYDGGKSFETHSGIDYEFRGRGLGNILYARAIQYALERGIKVSSSPGPSEQARRVWNGKTLRQHFNIRKYKIRYHAYVKF